MLLGSKIHTAGDTRLWKVNYDKWLDNSAEISAAAVTSSSSTLTITNIVYLGREIDFFVVGGVSGETVTVSIQMTDSLGNIKKDHLNFTVTAP